VSFAGSSSTLGFPRRPCVGILVEKKFPCREDDSRALFLYNPGMENTVFSKKGRKIASRQIEMKTFEAPEGRLIIEGELRDDRAVDFTGFSGRTIPAGRFHTLRARLLVNPEGMLIEDLEVEFQDYPYVECRDLAEKYRDLIGLTVESGFTRGILNRVGGKKGCAHLTHLLITMGPAFVQAAFTYQTRAESPTTPSREQTRKYFVDSCYVWRSEGEHAQKHG
jgi:hypothetical protein